VLLAAHGEIATAPDGHGGMLAALAKHVGFETLQRRGIDLLFYGQIDNPLLTVCDPEFLGYHLLAGSELTTQVVRKVLPEERVGVVAQIDGHLEIMEYSDLSPADAARRRDDGTLELWAGNTAVHAFDVAFLKAVSQNAHVALPLHLAKKKVPFVDSQGTLVEPTEPNAIKFERFIFDLLRLAKRALVVEVDRAVAFAPVKNAAGAASDTAEIAQAAMLAFDRALLNTAGVQLSAGVRVEINPNFALDAEELARRLPPGTRINQDTYLL
ncbi:MAG TPA: UTP--glucose-1-phosphate uridylyltransferase, partial [Pirellulaceae bacterium]|nr:UTP--glucose-1-phosphate uridylyltransferase [Pirellulaceae bacterium]